MEEKEKQSNNIKIAGSGDYIAANTINMTGFWFLYFGADVQNVKIEGSRILELKGNFDPDKLIDILVENIWNDLPEQGKKLLESNKRIVIRAFNRI